VISRDEFEKMIDAMANRNPEPIFVRVGTYYAPSRSPLYADNYDFNEDDRVRGVIKQLKHYDNEDVWRWLSEHRHDDRYALAYAFNDGAYISSIGTFCRRAVVETLQNPYLRHLPPCYNFSRPRLGPFASLDEEDAWFRDHPNMPLYQQQISLCEKAINKLIPTLRRGTDSDRQQFAADILSEIDGLKRSKQPTFNGFCMIYSETDRYNAVMAKQIRYEYWKLITPLVKMRVRDAAE
jgi:hypothetical protein